MKASLAALLIFALLSPTQAAPIPQEKWMAESAIEQVQLLRYAQELQSGLTVGEIANRLLRHFPGPQNEKTLRAAIRRHGLSLLEKAGVKSVEVKERSLTIAFANGQTASTEARGQVIWINGKAMPPRPLSLPELVAFLEGPKHGWLPSLFPQAEAAPFLLPFFMMLVVTPASYVIGANPAGKTQSNLEEYFSRQADRCAAERRQRLRYSLSETAAAIRALQERNVLSQDLKPEAGLSCRQIAAKAMEREEERNPEMQAGSPGSILRACEHVKRWSDCARSYKASERSSAPIPNELDHSLAPAGN